MEDLIETFKMVECGIRPESPFYEDTRLQNKSLPRFIVETHAVNMFKVESAGKSNDVSHCICIQEICIIANAFVISHESVVLIGRNGLFLLQPLLCCGNGVAGTPRISEIDITCRGRCQFQCVPSEEL